MIINPKKANFIKGAEESQFQPNGVDLRVGKVFKLAEDAVFTMSEHPEDKISKQIALNLEELYWLEDDKGEYTILTPGSYYLFDSLESVVIPSNASGKVQHRSSANRASMRVESGWYDAGFEGAVGGSIVVMTPIKLYKGTRIAQMILWESDSHGEYNGQWQGTTTSGEKVTN